MTSATSEHDDTADSATPRLHLLRHAMREAGRIGVDGEPEILVNTTTSDPDCRIGIAAECPTDLTSAFGGGGVVDHSGSDDRDETDVVLVDVDDCCVRYRRIGSQLDCLAGNIETLKFEIAPNVVRLRQSADRVSTPVVLRRAPLAMQKTGYAGGFDTDDTIKVALFALSYHQESDSGTERVTVSTRCFDVEVVVTVERSDPADDAPPHPFEVSLTYIDHGAVTPDDVTLYAFDLWQDQDVTLSNALIRLAMLVFDLAPTLRAADPGEGPDEQRLLVVGHPLRQQGFRYGATVIRCEPVVDRHSITTLGHGLSA